MSRPRPPCLPRRAAAVLAGGLLLLAACGQEPGAGPVAAGPSRPALASRPEVPPPEGPTTGPDEPLEACIAANLRGAGYDELAGRDARRKLRRLQVQADCQAQLGR